jgi:hypothetical protein
MDFEDILEPQVAAAAAVTAVVASPQVRNVLRRGAVYGLAGVIMTGDALTSFARGLGRGVQGARSGANGKAQAKAVPVESGNGEHTEG